MDRAAAEGWIRAYVEPVGVIETGHERPRGRVLRAPLAAGGAPAHGRVDLAPLASLVATF
jgi:hypothetical protein